MTTSVTIFQDVFNDVRCPQFGRDWGQRLTGRVPHIGMISWVAMATSAWKHDVDKALAPCTSAVLDTLLGGLPKGYTPWTFVCSAWAGDNRVSRHKGLWAQMPDWPV